MALEVESPPGGVSVEQPPRPAAPLVVAPSFGDDNNTFRLGLTPVACFRLEDVRFRFDSSFIQPAASREMARLATLVASFPDAPLSVFGHADPVGDDEYNKKLSGRRAMALFGMLTRNADLWETLFSQPLGNDKWGTFEIQTMLEATGNSPGGIDGQLGTKTSDAIKVFQRDNGLSVTGQADKATRAALFLAYMDAVCRDAGGKPFKLEKSAFLARGADPDGKGDFQGCGEFNPVLMFSAAENAKFSNQANKTERNNENTPNRRVMILLFKPGSVVAPDAWPCPKAKDGPADCRKRFFVDAAKRRTFQEKRRRFEETKDTFACRFYDRISNTSPCERSVQNPTIVSVRWSKEEVTPAHDIVPGEPTRQRKLGPPNAEGSIELVEIEPEEQLVSPLIATLFVPTGTPVTVEIRHAFTNALVATLSTPVVQGSIVVDPQTLEPPVFRFEAKHLPWDPHDKPFFFFKALIPSLGLTAETTRDFEGRPKETLRVTFWHAAMSDAVADSEGLTTQEEMQQVAGILTRDPHNKVLQHVIATSLVPLPQYGNAIRNSYAYHHASHGTIMCLVHPKLNFKIDANGNIVGCRERPGDPGRSVLVLGLQNPGGRGLVFVDDVDLRTTRNFTLIGAAEVKQTAAVPSVPRYLAYLNVCDVGFEKSLPEAYLQRGTRFVIAFAKTIPDLPAVTKALEFYDKWSGVHKRNPDKIPEVFTEVLVPLETGFRPRLFRAPGPPQAPVTANAVGDASGAPLGDSAETVLS